MTLTSLSKFYGRNLTLTSRTFAALVALSTFQKRMLLSILYLSNIISNMCYNVLVATLSLPQDKILFPLDCRLLRKKCIYILLTSLRNKFPLSVFTFLLPRYPTRQACTSMATHANGVVNIPAKT